MRRLVIHLRPWTVMVIAASVATATAAMAPVTVAVAAGPVARPAIRFSDDFNNGRLDGWQAVNEPAGVSARWAVNGAVNQTSNLGGSPCSTTAADCPGAYLLAGNPAWRDYDYTLRFAARDDDAIGTTFRFVNADNFYRFSLDRQRNRIRLVKKVRGRYTVLAQRTGGYTIGRWYTLRIIAAGASIQAFVNGTRILAATDTALTQGRFGLYTWAAQNTLFDDLTATVTADSFTIAVLPDTQYETAYRPPMFNAQTQ